MPPFGHCLWAVGIGKLSARKIDRVLGNRIPREQAQHAFALFALTLLGPLLLGVRCGLMLWTLLRTRSRSGTGEKQRQQNPNSGELGQGHMGVLFVLRLSGAPAQLHHSGILTPPQTPAR